MSDLGTLTRRAADLKARGDAIQKGGTFKAMTEGPKLAEDAAKFAVVLAFELENIKADMQVKDERLARLERYLPYLERYLPYADEGAA